EADSVSPAMRLTDFARTIPVVAAKMRAQLESTEGDESDPIEEFSFVIFNP
ncbi:MAG: hypothetical protein GWO24_16590, partial [Akkermansiaceae bacterium]|nr:hypothetical protein [Akkermansiaceae bacterium]